MYQMENFRVNVLKSYFTLLGSWQIDFNLMRIFKNKFLHSNQKASHRFNFINMIIVLK